MLGKLIDSVVSGFVTRRLNELPVIRRAKAVIDTYWDGVHLISKDFSQKTIDEERAYLMDEAISITTSPDPLMANRKKLVNEVFVHAKYQVLVLEPAPAPDPTGLRGKRGITGELRAHLVEIAEKNDDLRELMHGSAPSINWDNAWNLVLMRYRVTWVRARLHNEIRFALDDVNPQEDRDWFAPLLESQCAYQEAQLRKEIGLPSALSDCPTTAMLEETKLFAFARLANEGARYPDLEFDKMIREIEANKIFND